jgi:hypothetical protein
MEELWEHISKHYDEYSIPIVFMPSRLLESKLGIIENNMSRLIGIYVDV